MISILESGLGNASSAEHGLAAISTNPTHNPDRKIDLTAPNLDAANGAYSLVGSIAEVSCAVDGKGSGGS
jgi:hypothetical protein